MDNETKRRPILEQQLCFAIYSTAHAFNRVYRPLLSKLGLTYPQYLVMLALWERDAQTVKALAQQLLLDSGTMTPLLKRLEAAGLVLRRRDKTDERQMIVALSDEGRALEQRAAFVPDTVGCAVGLSEAENHALLEKVLAVRDSLHLFSEKTE